VTLKAKAAAAEACSKVRVLKLPSGQARLGKAFAPALGAVVMLLASGMRLGWLVHRELAQRQSSAAERQLLAADGNLVGIDANGKAVGPGAAGFGRLAPGDRLVAFVVHLGRADQDIGYWNAVLRGLQGSAQRRTQQLRFWGICDSGSGCGGHATAAAFPILGYLEPYEMRGIAVADVRGEALLFHGPEKAGVPLPIAATPGAEAQMILSANRGEVP
ncbi:MAG: hypothetical protein ACRD1E_10850, partial [Terriglobales bacterium]